MGDAKVSTNYSSSKYSDLNLSKKTNYILDKMQGNVAFVASRPPLEEVRTANNLYITSLGKVEYGTKEDTVLKNSCRQAVEKLLKSLALYVQEISNGDEAIILSSGFDVNKKATTIGQLDKPENLIVKPGDNKGAILVSCDVVNNANFYEFEYMEITADGSGIWIQRTSTKRKIQIEGLTSGKQYRFRVAAAGSDPSRIWSDEVSSYVL